MIQLKTRPYILRIILMLFVILAGDLRSQSYFSLILPREFEPATAHYLATGKTGVAASIGYFNLWTNPALLSRNESPVILSVSSGLRRFEEERSFPVIDMFDDVVTDNVYALNRHWYHSVSGGVVVDVPFLQRPLKVGLAYGPVWDIRYDYREEVRASLGPGPYNRDPVVGYHEIQRKGQIYATSVGFGILLLPSLTMGVALHALKGHDLSNQYSVTVFETDAALASDTTLFTDGSFRMNGTPFMYNIGLAYDLSMRFRLGFQIRSGVILGWEKISWTAARMERTQLPGFLTDNLIKSMDISLPPQISLGLTARLKNPIATKVALELYYTDWSRYELNRYYPNGSNGEDEISEVRFNFQETWEIRGGVEHLLVNRIPFRFGFVFSESPLGEEFEATLITVGGSYWLEKVILDIGAGYGSVSYRYEDLFIATGAETSPLETVSESNLTVLFTVSYPF